MQQDRLSTLIELAEAKAGNEPEARFVLVKFKNGWHADFYTETFEIEPKNNDEVHPSAETAIKSLLTKRSTR